MPHHFVADGDFRRTSSPEYRDKRRLLWASVESRYQWKWAQAGFTERFFLKWQMWAEFKREQGQREPSQYSLY